MNPSILLGQLAQTAIGAIPSTVLALAGLVVATVLLRRRASAGLLAAAGSVLILVGNLLVLAAGPLGSVLIGLTFSGRMTSGRMGLIINAYSAFGSVVAAVAMALLIAAALVAMRGRPEPRRLPPHVHGERFVVGLAYTSVATAVVAIAVLALGTLDAAHALGLTGGRAGHPSPSPSASAAGCSSGLPNPSPPIDPGTYSAGTLQAPRTLHGECRSEPTTAREVKDTQQARNDFSTALAGRPAIFANYGSLMNLLQLSAGQGYVTPEQYFAGSKVTYTTIGNVTCGTLAVTICLRSDATQQLTVAVSGFADPPVVAAAVDEAWHIEGGH